MRKRSKILLGSVIGVVLALTLEAVVINLTAPMPSSQVVSKIEQNPSFKAETANATYTYLGYDNGRSSPIHCGPVITGFPLSQIEAFAHLLWPPANYTAVSFIFLVGTNSTSPSGFPYPYGGLLYVEANPSNGQIYEMNAMPVCI
jgi:hypothetical protein